MESTVDDRTNADSNADENGEKKYLYEIKFTSAAIYNELHEQMLAALRSISRNGRTTWEFTLAEEGNGDGNVVLVRAFQSVVNAVNGDSPTPRKNANERGESPDLTGISELFQIDTLPARKLDTITVPSYKRAIKDALDEDSALRKRHTNTEDQCQRPSRGAGAECFNCGSTAHSMRECTKPRNNKRINRAKKAFGIKQERYHVDVEQRFAHIRPGNISNELLGAMGLRRGEVPFFFYRMRVLGYPPGWLEDAKVTHSGIALFNSQGVDEQQLNANEIEFDTTNHKYNVKKIIDFPGFNVDPGAGFYDDYLHHNVPPMSHHHMKAEFIKSLGSNITKGYRHRKPKGKSNEETSIETADMEPEDGEEITPLVLERSLSPTQRLPTISDMPRESSPTLADLEAQQKQLLLELQTNPTLKTSVTESDPGAPATPQAVRTPSQADSTSKPDIKESHMGTPLLKFSPYDKLPKGDNFKVGVSDVINFENLPDSTGKYENLKLVIKKVRNIRSQLSMEEDE